MTCCLAKSKLYIVLLEDQTAICLLFCSPYCDTYVREIGLFGPANRRSGLKLQTI